MLRTLGTLAIVLFWLSSVAWLCATIWAPPESRMARIDPMEVYEVFFTSADSTEMALLENGRRRGDLIVSAARRLAEAHETESAQPQGNPDEESPEGPGQPGWVNAVSLNARLIRYTGPQGDFEVDLSARIHLEFSLAMERLSTDLTLRHPEHQLVANFKNTIEPPRTEAEVLLGPQTLFSVATDGGPESLGPLLALAASGGGGLAGLGGLGTTGGLPGLPALPGGLGALLPSLSGLLPPSQRPDGESGENAVKELPWTVEARRGSFSFGGHSFRAYLLILRLEGREEAVRLYFSEAGEPLRIATDFGFEAVSEILVPLDAYRPTPSMPDPKIP